MELQIGNTSPTSFVKLDIGIGLLLCERGGTRYTLAQHCEENSGLD
jgi:hypothetical protein